MAAAVAIGFVLGSGREAVVFAGDEPPSAGQKTKNGASSGVEGHHGAELGVAIAATPGNGVLVAEVAPDSPAAVGGLRAGDYLLAIDGKEIGSPEELRSAIQAKKPGAKVELTVWRRGKTTQTEVKLPGTPERAAEGKDKPWLGLVLESSDEPGAVIDLVHPLGPAKDAGLRPGDVILKIDGQKVKSAEDALEKIESLQPKTTVNLVISRKGKEQTVQATLGSTQELLEALQHRALRPLGRFDRFGNFQPRESGAEAGERSLPEVVERLRDEVAALRKEVQILREKGRDQR
jgi:S1-C subfamily serine protease